MQSNGITTYDQVLEGLELFQKDEGRGTSFCQPALNGTLFVILPQRKTKN